MLILLIDSKGVWHLVFVPAVAANEFARDTIIRMKRSTKFNWFMLGSEKQHLANAKCTYVFRNINDNDTELVV